MISSQRGRDKTLTQDGFSMSIRTVPDPKPENRDLPVSPIEDSKFLLANNGDNTYTVIRCMDVTTDDMDLSRELSKLHVSMIAARAFQHCGAIRRIVLPDGLRQIGEMAFLGCAQLQYIEIPGSVERIGTLAFARCQKLTHIRMQPGVRSIGPSAFQKCPCLQRVELPGSITEFGGGLFLGSPQVTLYGASGSMAEKYALENGIRFDSESWKEDPVLEFQENGDASLTVIGLKTPQRYLEIPREICGRRIVAIAPRAFIGRQEIESVRIVGTRIIGENAFMACPQLVRVILEQGVEEIESGAFAGCEKLPQIALPDGIKTVRRMAFFGCAHLSFVRIPPMTRVEALAFEGCSPMLRLYNG